MFKMVLGSAICLALVFPAQGFTQSAQAATCKVAGGQSGSLKYSGQVNSISAKVCGNEIWKLLPKPKVVKKPSNPTAKKKTWKNEFTVSPTPPKIGYLGSLAKAVNEVLALNAITGTHILNRRLLWYPSQVRFTPQTYSWDFGDGQVSTNQQIEHDWHKAGTYVVNLVVGYSVKYRIIGKSEWVALAGTVFGKAKPVTVVVGKGSGNDANVSLVHWNCLQKQTASGC